MVLRLYKTFWVGKTSVLEFVTLALSLGRFPSCLVSFEPTFYALSNGTRGTVIRPLVTEIFTFYFVLLITPEPSPGFLAFDLACVLAYADLRLPTFHTPQFCYLESLSAFLSLLDSRYVLPLNISVLSSHCWTPVRCFNKFQVHVVNRALRSIL